MKLPAVANPQRYVGLYVYDFGTHVSVGYTAAEVRILRESGAHCTGTAYEIYRATEDGGFELRGILDERLRSREAMCFLRADATAARHDFDHLRQAAEAAPLPCAVDLHLARIDGFDPPNVTALLYDASATSIVAQWLSAIGFAGGDRVIGGIDVHTRFVGADGVRIHKCTLLLDANYHDRPADEVLRTVNKPIQR